MDLTTALAKTLSIDASLSNIGQKVLDKNLQSNFQEYLKTLSDVVFRPHNEFVLRKAAARSLHNALTPSDDFKRVESHHKWMSMHEYVRQYIKKNLIQALVVDVTRPSVVAECIGAVACAEIVTDGRRWRELMNAIISNSVKSGSNKNIRSASLEAIGYICRDVRDWSCLDRKTLNEVCCEIYSSIVMCLKHHTKQVRLSAINALNQALSWIVPNCVNSESDRKKLLSLIFHTAKSNCTNIKLGAINCLIDILSDCYDAMSEAMDEELFNIMIEAMYSKTYQVLLRGTNLCRKICFLECSLTNHRIAPESGYPNRHIRFFTNTRISRLLTTITNMLFKYELYGDRDEDHISETLVHCLTSLALCYDDTYIRRYIIHFVEENLEHESWQKRNAAVRVFSSLISDEMGDIQLLLNETLPILIQLLNDDITEVKATAADVIAKLCDHITTSDVFEPNMGALLKSLLKSASGKQIVATNACIAFAHFAIATKEFDIEIHKRTEHFQDVFSIIIHKMIDAMTRKDAEDDLRWAAYYALDCLLDSCTKNYYLTVLKSAEMILKKLQLLLQELKSVLLCTKCNQLVTVLCVTLKLFLKNLRPEDSRPICFKAMNILVQIFNMKSFDEELMDQKLIWALSTFVKMLGDVFAHYMTSFRPCLVAALKSCKKYSLQAAVTLTGEVAVAVGCKFYPYCDDVVPLLVDILRNEGTDRCLKQLALTTVGTVARESGAYFRRFLRSTLRSLTKMQLQLDKIHMEVKYDRGYNLCEMHKHFLKAYIGIISSMRSDQKTVSGLKEHLRPCIVNMIRAIVNIAENRNYLPMYDSSCVEVLSDLCTHFARDLLLPLMDTKAIDRLILHASNSLNKRTKKLGNQVTLKLDKLKTR